MFQVTTQAAAVLAKSRDRKGRKDSLAVRLSPSETDDGSTGGYQMRFADRPAPDDVVMETAGTKVFLAADVADRLQRLVLDVKDGPKGPKLVLRKAAKA